MSSLCARTLSLLPSVLLTLYALFSASICVQAGKTTKQRPFNNSISAVFVFGDSTVDPGNNNFISTPARSNFQPYGMDFANRNPTGRFTNGKLVTDFIASYVGIKEYVPPYLDPTLTIEELMTGVSFASAASGFDPMTAHISKVISVQKQLDYFIEYKRRLEIAIGRENTKNLIKKASFLISAGTNDIVITYFGSPYRRQRYSTVSSYQNFLFQIIQQFTQGLLDQGAELIAYVGMPPMGCLPIVITLNLEDAFHHRGCIEGLSYVGRDYNQKLQKKLKAMQDNSSAKFYYADIYTPLDNMIQTPSKFGFTHVDVGCCGTGLLEASYLCNRNSHVCSDRSKYVFWDSIHPTEATYYQLFKSLRPMIDDAIKA